MNKKVKTITTWLAAAIFLLALAINIKVTLDDPFVMLSDEAIAQTTTDDESGTGEKNKYCREVNCSDTWSGTANGQGCIFFFGEERCLYSANVEVSFTYYGKNENCTGGSEWYDCDACQDDCVPEPKD